MMANPYAGRLDQEILSADPVELVGVAFDHLLACLAEARTEMVSGNVQARTRSVNKAFDLLSELVRAVDVEKGGEIARQSLQLYDFALGRLAQAQTQKLEQPLVDAIRCLAPLRDAWKELGRRRQERCGAMLAPAAAHSGLAVHA